MTYSSPQVDNDIRKNVSFYDKSKTICNGYARLGSDGKLLEQVKALVFLSHIFGRVSLVLKPIDIAYAELQDCQSVLVRD